MLPAETYISHVRLQVSDLARSLAFYRDALGLQMVSASAHSARLSASGTSPFQLELIALPDAVARPARTSGLYHLALRLPSRAALGRVFYRLVAVGRPFQGFADHKVSEALYLADPDDIGLELYRDRPRASWPRLGDQVAMTSDPLDVESLLQEGEHAYDGWQGIDPATDIGHLHLNVGSLERARAFYVDLLGMDIMQASYPGALFVAAGGYHHHLGFNTWAGKDIPPSPSNAVGIHSFGIHIPGAKPWTEAVERFRFAGVDIDGHSSSGVPMAALRDNDGIRVELVQGA